MILGCKNLDKKSMYALLMGDPAVVMYKILGNTIYNFGFIGTTAIEITESSKAILVGDNRGYNPRDPATIWIA